METDLRLNWRPASTCWPFAIGVALCASCGGGNDEANVDGGPRCEAVIQPVSDCQMGAAHAVCPGPNTPRAFCSKNTGEWCLWVSNGCPVGDYVLPVTQDCTCDSPLCFSEAEAIMASFVGEYGTSAWTAETSMNLEVAVASVAIAEPSIVCTPTAEEYDAPNHPCGADAFETRVKYPGTAVWEIVPAEVHLSSTRLEIEIDFSSSPGRARACWIQSTDSPRCQGAAPRCALGGGVTLESIPQGPEDLRGIHLSLVLEFADGLTVTGAI